MLTPRTLAHVAHKLRWKMDKVRDGERAEEGRGKGRKLSGTCWTFRACCLFQASCQTPLIPLQNHLHARFSRLQLQYDR